MVRSLVKTTCFSRAMRARLSPAYGVRRPTSRSRTLPGEIGAVSFPQGPDEGVAVLLADLSALVTRPSRPGRCLSASPRRPPEIYFTEHPEGPEPISVRGSVKRNELQRGHVAILTVERQNRGNSNLMRIACGVCGHRPMCGAEPP
jgi:hypothetical protein